MNAIINLITKDTTKEDHRKSYENYPDTNPKGIEDFHASTVEPIFCEIPEGSKVLDIGCNSGEMMRLLSTAKSCDVRGVDISKSVVKLARSKGLKVKTASAEDLPFPDSSFDVVVMREVFVHLLDQQKSLQEIKRVLKPEGFLIGSTPHKNLERNVWDDPHLHHEYPTEESLKDSLTAVFETAHINVLSGGQFKLGLANSHMGDLPAEILFKCGGKDLPKWEDAFTSDKETLRIWMGPTQQPGTAYYRMIGFASKMRGMKGVEVGFENFRWDSNDQCSDWQRKILIDDEDRPVSMVALDHLEKCLKVANPWIFQVTYYEDILHFFRSAKETYPDKKLITECDDWMFDLPAYNVASNPYKPGSEKERIAFEQFELSDAIIVSTSFLKEKLGVLFPEKPIHIIPNAIDFDIWDVVKSDGKLPKKEGVVRIHYSGCGNHNGDLEIIKPVLLALLDEFPNLEIIMAAEFECFKDVTNPRFIIPRDANGNQRWETIQNYPAMVKGWGSDIGIAPLRDNDFNRAKSNLRWLENSALKIPTVCSNVRPFAESVKEGEGYLCSTKQDWYAKLKDLILHPELREAIGLNAYNRTKTDFNMTTVSEGYAKLLKEIRC